MTRGELMDVQGCRQDSQCLVLIYHCSETGFSFFFCMFFNTPGPQEKTSLRKGGGSAESPSDGWERAQRQRIKAKREIRGTRVTGIPAGLPSRAERQRSKSKGGRVINTRSCSRQSSSTETQE